MELVWISQARNILNRVLYFFCHCDMIIGKNRRYLLFYKSRDGLKDAPA
jgi:hypothetical protein